MFTQMARTIACLAPISAPVVLGCVPEFQLGASVVINQAPDSVVLGETFAVTATAEPADRPVSWSATPVGALLFSEIETSTDANGVATVTATARAAGTITIHASVPTYTAWGGRASTSETLEVICQADLSEAPIQVSVGVWPPIIRVGDSLLAMVSVTSAGAPQAACDVEWQAAHTGTLQRTDPGEGIVTTPSGTAEANWTGQSAGVSGISATCSGVTSAVAPIAVLDGASTHRVVFRDQADGAYYSTDLLAPSDPAPVDIGGSHRSIVGYQRGGSMVITVDEWMGGVHLRHLGTGKQTAYYASAPYTDRHDGAAISGDGHTVYRLSRTTSGVGVARTDTEGGGSLMLYAGGGGLDATMVSLSPDGRQVAVRTEDGNVSLLSALGRGCGSTLAAGGYAGRIQVVTWLDNEALAAAVSGQGSASPEIVRIPLSGSPTVLATASSSAGISADWAGDVMFSGVGPGSSQSDIYRSDWATTTAAPLALVARPEDDVAPMYMRY